MYAASSSPPSISPAVYAADTSGLSSNCIWSDMPRAIRKKNDETPSCPTDARLGQPWVFKVAQTKVVLGSSNDGRFGPEPSILAGWAYLCFADSSDAAEMIETRRASFSAGFSV